MRVNLTRIPARFSGLWIAVAVDEKTVLAHASTAEAALRKACKKGYRTVIITHVPKPEIPNDDLLQAIAEAEEEERNGTVEYFTDIDEFRASLDR